MDGQRKSAFESYKQFSNKKAIKLTTPCETRVMYVHTVLVDLIRSCHTLHSWCTTKNAENPPPEVIRDAWPIDSASLRNLSEIEAVLRPLANLSFKVQTEASFCKAGTGFLQRMYIYILYSQTAQRFRVVNINRDYSSWAPDTLFEDLLKSNSVVMTTDPKEASEKCSLMCIEARDLQKRIVEEFDIYLGKPSKLDLVALLLNPIGLMFAEGILDQFETGLFSEAKHFLVEEFNNFKKNMDDGEKSPPVANVMQVIYEEDSYEDPFTLVTPLKGSKSSSLISESQNSSDLQIQRPKSECERWLDMHFNLDEEANDQGESIKKTYRKIRNHKNEEVSDVGSYDFFEVANKLNPLKIWKKIHKDWPVMHRLALKFLADPGSNAFIERSFSGVTFIDTIYRQMAKDETKYDNALLYLNKDNIESFTRRSRVWISEQLKKKVELECFLNASLEGNVQAVRDSFDAIDTPVITPSSNGDQCDSRGLKRKLIEIP